MQEKTTESRILDATGRPFKVREAKELQTDDVRLAGLHRTFSNQIGRAHV